MRTRRTVSEKQDSGVVKPAKADCATPDLIPHTPNPNPDFPKIRTCLRIEDIRQIVRYHDEYYAANYGFNHDFGKYVEGPLMEFFKRNSPDEGIWLLDENNTLKGCVALVKNSDEEAQLRWFYVDESLRGQGYGQRLMNFLITFAVERHYQRIILWTVSQLEEARRVYEKNGFVLGEEHRTRIWGQDLVEQKFVKIIRQFDNSTIR